MELIQIATLDPTKMAQTIELLDLEQTSNLIEITDNAAVANRLARRHRGRLLEDIQGQRTDLLPAGNKLSAVDRKNRSQERLINEWDTETNEFNEDEGWNKNVTKANAWKRESTVADLSAVADLAPDDVQLKNGSLLHGDFRDKLDDLPDGSVDLIVTDPPYPYEDIELWSELGGLASRLLGPRGILFAWSGQMFLPEVMDRLSDDLTYGWTFCLNMEQGSNARIMGRHMIQTWKPILAYTKEKWPSGKWGSDVVVSPSVDKELYEWQQNAGPAQTLIERYSAQDGLVVDPMMGVGSFGVAAQEAGRRFIGVEIDGERFEQAAERLL